MKILLIQRRSLGDALYSALVAEVIKKEKIDAKVEFLTLPFAVNFFNTYKFIDKTLPHRGLFENLKNIFGKYDAILDYEATFRTYPLVLLSKARNRVAFYRKKRERFLYPVYNHFIKYKNFGFTFWDRLKLLEPLGIDYEKYIKNRYFPKFQLKVEAGEKDFRKIYGEYIVFTPKGILPTKEIKPKVVKNIYERIQRELNLNIVIAVEPREREYIKALNSFGLEVFSEDLVSFTRLLEKAKALLSIESFPYHLALLLRVPSVVVVQGYDIWFKERFGLIEEYKPPLECVPCWKRNRCLRGDFACTHKMEVDIILQKLKRIISRR